MNIKDSKWLAFHVSFSKLGKNSNTDCANLAPFIFDTICKFFVIAQCWVYVMSIGHDEDMKSKCHISHTFWTNYIFGKIKTLCYINFKNDVTIVPLFFQKIICSRDMRDVTLWFYVFIMANDLTEWIECQNGLYDI